MLVFGLVHGSGWEPPDHGWEPPEDEPPKRCEWDWHMVPWRSLAWLALWCVLMAIVAPVSGTFGGLAGFAFRHCRTDLAPPRRADTLARAKFSARGDSWRRQLRIAL